MSTMCPETGIRRSQRGFSLVTAIFLLVVLAGLGAAMVVFSTSQHQTVALDAQSARGYRAARAGIEWGAYQVLKVANACPTSPTTLTFTGAPLAAFSTSVICTATTHTEGANTVTHFAFTATATYGAPNTSDYIARVVNAQIVRCVDPGGQAC